MKTIGEILKQARLSQKKTLTQVASATKIRLDYIESLEKNEFEQLPSATFVKGFIRNYAKFVDVDPSLALAVFRRDFDQNQQGKIIPRGMTNPLKPPSKIWNPKTTTFVLSVVLIILIGMYSFKQILSATAAPQIILTHPSQEQIMGNIVTVRGKTRSDAIVRVNNKPVALDINGNFETIIDLAEGTHTLIIEAESRDGKIRTISKNLSITAE